LSEKLLAYFLSQSPQKFFKPCALLFYYWQLCQKSVTFTMTCSQKSDSPNLLLS